MTKFESAKKGNEPSYIYPRAEEIIIDRSNLHIQLDKFKKRIQASLSIYDLIIIVSLWTPILAATFNDVFYLQGNVIKTGYCVFSFIITGCIAYYKINSLFKNKGISDDPENMAKIILEQCQKRII